MSEHVSLITFRVHAGKETAFVAAFTACGMLSRPRQIEGFVSAELLRARDDPSRFAVVGRWTTPEAYAAWQAVSQSGAPREALIALAACIAETAPGKLYDLL